MPQKKLDHFFSPASRMGLESHAPCQTAASTEHGSGSTDPPSACHEEQASEQLVARRWKKKRSSSPAVPAVASKSQKLSNGFQFPLLGFGTWSLHGSELCKALAGAVKAGYRLIDTSSAYGNEAAIGQTLKELGCTEELVLQSKIGPRHMGHAKAREAALNSIRSLGRLDILLIHWPGRSRKQRFATWQVLEDLYSEGHVRAIGVSNFLPEHVEDLMKDGAKIKPMLNQFELHPLCQSGSIVEYCHQNDIAIQSYSTLGGGPAKGSIRLENGTGILLGHPVVTCIAQETGRSCASVCLRWAIQKNFSVIPKSRALEHVQNNADAFDFELTEDQMHRLQNLDQDRHFAWDPRSL